MLGLRKLRGGLECLLVEVLISGEFPGFNKENNMTRLTKSVEKRIDGIIRGIRSRLESLSALVTIEDMQLVINNFKEQVDAQAEKIKRARIQGPVEAGQESVESVHSTQKEAG